MTEELPELAEKAELRVPLDHKLQCPACHERLDIVVIVGFSSGSARVSGGDTFRSNISAGLDSTAKRLHIQAHICNLEKG